MAAPKKYMAPVSFSFRAENNEWEDFTMVLRLEKDTPTAFFTRSMREYLKEKKTLVSSVRNAMQSAQGVTKPEIPNAETREAMAELRAGKGEKVTIDQIMAELNAGN